jgi:co-chaperonin GroES (HSP10)
VTSLELTPEQAAQGYRPLAGRILLEIERNPSMIGSLHVPEVAQDKTERDELQTAKVLAIGYGRFREGDEWFPGITEGDVKPGDRVLFAALMKDLNRAVILTAVTRVAAVVEA